MDNVVCIYEGVILTRQEFILWKVKKVVLQTNVV